jgi:hypothetical protein
VKLRTIAFLFVLAACGARTELEVIDRDAGPDAQRQCALVADCDDGIDCTVDRCQSALCSSSPNDERCEDDVFCNGMERCDPTLGCVSSPVACTDAIECTFDSCNEDEDACEHRPDADLCPISHRCDEVVGCVARALVHDSAALYEVDLPSGNTHWLASTTVGLTDLALHPDRRLFGINHRALYALDESTGRAGGIADLPDQMVALEIGPDLMLYAAGQSRIARVDPETGASTPFATFPTGWMASGDIAFVRGRLLVTATDAPFDPTRPDFLFEVPIDGRTPFSIGSIGSHCVWGVAAFGDTLYGFTCNGDLLLIDIDTATGTVLRNVGIRVGGAAAR